MSIALEEAQIYDPYEAYMRQVIDDHFKYTQLNDKLVSLPDSLLDFVFSPEPAEFIKDRVAVSLNLNEKQTMEVAKIILEIVVTDLYLGNVVEALKERIGIDEQKAKTIAGLIVAELFAPILDELKKMHIEKFAKNIPRQTQSVQNQSNQEYDDRVIDLKNSL